MLFRSLLAVFVAMILLPSQSEAQNRRLLQNINRQLGLWQGNGRHWQTPGPAVGYYNPWSAHNSGLVTRGMAYQPRFQNRIDYSQQFFPPVDIGPATITPGLAPLASPLQQMDSNPRVPKINPAQKAPNAFEPRLPPQLEEPKKSVDPMLPDDALDFSKRKPIKSDDFEPIQW